MSEHSTIEWTDATWNPVTGCSVVSPGCTNCYAMGLAGTRLQHHPSRAGLTRPSKSGPVWNGVVRLNEEWLTQPLQWKRPRMIFVCAHGDLFHESVPDAWIDRVFAVMASCSQHTFQVLTKRSTRMREYLAAPDLWERIALRILTEHMPANAVIAGGAENAAARASSRLPLPNIWLGVSAEDQRRADERVPDLLATPAAVRFVSAEPLLGPIDLRSFMWPVHGWWRGPHNSYAEAKAAGAECGLKRQALVGAWCTFLDWVIVGGESGTNARPMHPAWARSIRDQCAAAGVAFHFKQHGTWADVGPHPRGEYVSSDPRAEDPIHDGDPVFMAPIGKKAAGRLLDGVEHNGMPAAGGARG